MMLLMAQVAQKTPEVQQTEAIVGGVFAIVFLVCITIIVIAGIRDND